MITNVNSNILNNWVVAICISLVNRLHGRKEMKNLTRNGVAKDLSKSPYIFTEFIEGRKVDFYFSSKLHLDNFTKRRKDNHCMLYNHIYKRFKFKMNCWLLSDCNLYKKIETRGFYIKVNGTEVLCPDNIILNGELRTSENFVGWRETLMINYAG